jgi:thiol:disulfide interchange protein DsbD
MLRKILLVMALMILVAGAAQAQMKTSASVVKAQPASATVTGTPGQRVSFEVKLDIGNTWHIYAHGDTNFIGVDLVPDEFFPLDDFQAVYPEGHEGEFFGEKVVMIEGKDVIKASAQVPAGMPAGEYELNLAVTVQACDDKTCLAPADLPIAVKLKLE